MCCVYIKLQLSWTPMFEVFSEPERLQLMFVRRRRRVFKMKMKMKLKSKPGIFLRLQREVLHFIGKFRYAQGYFHKYNVICLFIIKLQIKKKIVNCKKRKKINMINPCNKTSQQVIIFFFNFLGKYHGSLQKMLKKNPATMVHPCNCSLLRLLAVCIVIHGIGKVIV